MEYKGYKIEHEGNHYKVTSPDGDEWREDTVRDAKDYIDALERTKENFNHI